MRFRFAFPVGLLVMCAFVWLIEVIGQQLSPPSAEMRAAIALMLKGDPAAQQAMIDAAPTVTVANHLWVLGAWVTGAAAGAWAACRMAQRMQIPMALAIGILQALLAVTNMLFLPHPAWMWALGTALPLGAAVLVGRAMRNSAPPPSVCSSEEQPAHD